MNLVISAVILCLQYTWDDRTGVIVIADLKASTHLHQTEYKDKVHFSPQCKSKYSLYIDVFCVGLEFKITNR